MRGKRERRRGDWPGRVLLTGTGLVTLSFLMPLLSLEDAPPPASAAPVVLPPAASASPTPTPVPPVDSPASTPRPGWDGGQALTLLCSDGSIRELTMAEYLQGVVSSEMPASFLPEALKAQAVAARTYCLYQRTQQSDKHPQADVCTDSTCCQACLMPEERAAKWGEEAIRYTDKITQAVADTDGLVCLYEGEPIDAVFFSSAEGRTSSSGTVWGRELPYLASVESPEGDEVPGLHTVTSFSPDEFAGRFLTAHPEAALGGSPSEWFSEPETDPAGTVTAITVGGATVTGGELRRLCGLRSARFTVTAGEKEIAFFVTGYGHGVGMSQYGANALAGEGKNFEEILKWYYTGITVEGAP